MNNQQNNKVVVGLGEVLWDVLPAGKQLGGAPANFAYHVSQFGFESYAISAIGADDLGNEIISTLSDKPLKTCFPKVDFPTGTVQVTLDAKGVPSYEIMEGVAWDNIPFNQEIEAIAERTACVCFGSLAQRNAASQDTISKFLSAVSASALRVFDINLRQHYYSKELIEQSIKMSNVLKINDDELEIVTPMFQLQSGTQSQRAEHLRKMYGLEMLILTCGTNGSYVFADEHESFEPTPKVEVVDTVGAGDSFTAAFCASIMLGKTLKEAHHKAVERSAYVCTKAGAMPCIE